MVIAMPTSWFDEYVALFVELVVIVVDPFVPEAIPVPEFAIVRVMAVLPDVVLTVTLAPPAIGAGPA
jgi:hypothetical protein